MQVFTGQYTVIDSLCRHIAANKQGRGTQSIHDIELTLCPVKVTGHLGCWHAFKVAKGLQGNNGDTIVVSNSLYFFG